MSEPQDEIATTFRTAMRLDESFAIDDRMGFDDVPGWDSVGHMNLISQLESRFGVMLEMDEIVALDSVGAVRRLVAGKVERRRMTEILVETLLQRAASQPQQPALVAAGETFSYGQLATMIRATAARIGRAIGGRGAGCALRPQLSAPGRRVFRRPSGRRRGRAVGRRRFAGNGPLDRRRRRSAVDAFRPAAFIARAR